MIRGKKIGSGIVKTAAITTRSAGALKIGTLVSAAAKGVEAANVDRAAIVITVGTAERGAEIATEARTDHISTSPRNPARPG